MPLNIFEPRYLAMVDAAMAGDRVIGMVQPDESAAPCARGPALRTVGCAGRIISFAETGDGRYMITLTGIARFRIVEELACGTPFRQCRVTTAARSPSTSPARRSAVDRNAVLRTFRAYLDAHNLDADWESVGRASERDAGQRARHDGAVRPGRETGAARGARPQGPRRDAGRAHRDGARRPRPTRRRRRASLQ